MRARPLYPGSEKPFFQRKDSGRVSQYEGRGAAVPGGLARGRGCAGRAGEVPAGVLRVPVATPGRAVRAGGGGADRAGGGDAAVPEPGAGFRRGHGMVYQALAEGRIDEERLRDLLVRWRPRDWPLVFAVDASTYPRPAAETSPGREWHPHSCKGHHGRRRRSRPGPGRRPPGRPGRGRGGRGLGVPVAGPAVLRARTSAPRWPAAPMAGPRSAPPAGRKACRGGRHRHAAPRCPICRRNGYKDADRIVMPVPKAAGLDRVASTARPQAKAGRPAAAVQTQVRGGIEDAAPRRSP